MSRTDIPVFSTGLELSAAPINPAWIVDGAPHARNRILWTSTDKTGFCMLWDCTAGQFNWTYHLDELVHVIEGGVTVTGTDGIAKTLRAGDVALFPKGTVVHWHIENYVRKVAYCQKQLPEMIALPVRVLRKLKSLLARTGTTKQPALDDAFSFGGELGIGIDFHSLTKGNPGAQSRQ